MPPFPQQSGVSLECCQPPKSPALSLNNEHESYDTKEVLQVYPSLHTMFIVYYWSEWALQAAKLVRYISILDSVPKFGEFQTKYLC